MSNGERAMYAKRGFFRFTAVAVVGVVSALLSACGDDDGSELTFTAVAGADCQDCEICKDLINSCVCDTCTEYAFDAERKQLLVCAGVWTVYKECPGGVLAACSNGGYDLKCLDESGPPK